jgi:hypothetical protein
MENYCHVACVQHLSATWQCGLCARGLAAAWPRFDDPAFFAPLWAGLRFCLGGIATALAETARLMRLGARLRSPSRRLTRSRPTRRDMESAKARSCQPLFILLCPLAE